MTKGVRIWNLEFRENLVRQYGRFGGRLTASVVVRPTSMDTTLLLGT